ncbi:MAG TPA: HAMP domain-containing sensor histidine kinase [Terriglobales bacterium]
MTFRRRLLLLFALTVAVSVIAVAWMVSTMARRAFDRANDERTAALVAQFRHEFNRRRDEVSRRIQAAASTPEAQRMAVAAAQASPNYNAFLDDAQSVAESQQLDFLEFTDDRGTIISSAQWPAKFGYKEPLAASSVPAGAFLKAEETPPGTVLGLFAVRTAAAGDRKLYVIGGVRLNSTFLSTLELPAGMRVFFYENLDPSAGFVASHVFAASGTLQDAQPLASVIETVAREPREMTTVVHWDSGQDETVNAFPMKGENNQLLGILLVGSSREIYNQLRSQIRSAAFLAAAAGLLLAILLSSWAAARVTKPVEELAHAAHDVAAGNWDTQVRARSNDELGELAESFNRMTRELIEHRERLVQAERVAAWRELARRLAHELKNPLFPLQLTVENLIRSRDQDPQLFDSTFRESAAALLSEIANLKNIIARFSEFSKMPQPQFRRVEPNDLLKTVAMTHKAQLEAAGIECRLDLHAAEPIAADPDLLYRALSNLVLNAIDAMPQGGTLTLRASQAVGSARMEVADSGPGLAAEESARLFTPYYTSKPQGTGLGLAIVQSIVSDHGGRISVSSQPGEGTTFIIELPSNRDKVPASAGMHI